MKFIEALNVAGVEYSITRTISSPIYNGFSITVKDDKAILHQTIQESVRQPISFELMVDYKYMASHATFTAANENK